MCGSEQRRQERPSLHEVVRVSWPDSTGGGILKTAPARLAELSELGMRIKVSQPIPVRSLVHVRAERYNLHGPACARFCRQVGVEYEIELEFTGGLRWKRPVLQLVPQPVHAQAA